MILIILFSLLLTLGETSDCHKHYSVFGDEESTITCGNIYEVFKLFPLVSHHQNCLFVVVSEYLSQSSSSWPSSPRWWSARGKLRREVGAYSEYSWKFCCHTLCNRSCGWNRPCDCKTSSTDSSQHNLVPNFTALVL